MIDVNGTRCNPAVNSLLLFISMFCFGFFKKNVFLFIGLHICIYVGFPNATVTRNHRGVPKKVPGSCFCSAVHNGGGGKCCVPDGDGVGDAPWQRYSGREEEGSKERKRGGESLRGVKTCQERP